MKKKTAALLVTGGVALMAAVFAHHSFVRFDQRKAVNLTGTVQGFEWQNPHSLLALDVPGKGGSERQWTIVMGSPLVLDENGWSSHTVKPGDRITVTVHPSEDGSPSGQYLAATLPNGKEFVNPHEALS